MFDYGCISDNYNGTKSFEHIKAIVLNLWHIVFSMKLPVIFNIKIVIIIMIIVYCMCMCNVQICKCKLLENQQKEKTQKKKKCGSCHKIVVNSSNVLD